MAFEKIKEIFGITPKQLEDISADGKLSDIETLTLVKAALAKVYQSQVTDEIFDNGNLTSLNKAILLVSSVIEFIKTRSKEA